MKKFWKIFGITLGTLIAAVVIVALIAIYIIFTPQKLTPIVRNVADNYITAQHEIGDVELTFFSTFPNAAIKINGLLVVNPFDQAPSDTVLYSPEVIAKLNLIKLMSNALEVDGLQINQTLFNGFIDAQGQANFDVLNLDTTASEPDTTAFALPFEQMNLQNIKIDISKMSFAMLATDSTSSDLSVSTNDGFIHLSDAQTNNNAGTAKLALALNNANIQSGTLQAKSNLSINSPVEFNLDDMHFHLSKANLSLLATDLALNNEQYVSNGTITLQSAITADLNDQHFNVERMVLTYNDFDIMLNADVVLCANEDIRLNADAQIKDWNVGQLLKVLPQPIAQQISDIKADGNATINAKAKGIYNQQRMPIIDADISVRELMFGHSSLPFDVEQTEGNIIVHLDMNDSTNSKAQVKHLKAKARNSTIDLFGEVNNLLAQNMTADATAKFDLNLPDIKDFLPETMSLKGRTNGKIVVKGKIADIADLKLNNAIIDGNAQISKLDFTMDSIAAKSEKANLTFRLPNNRATKKTVSFLRAQLDLQGLDFTQTGNLQASVGSSNATIETSNLLSNDPVIKANIKFNTDRLKAQTDSLNAEISMPDIKAYVEYNTKDSTAIPAADIEFAIEDIEVEMDSLNAHIVEPRGTANLAASRLNTKEPALQANLKIGSADIAMGNNTVKTDNMNVRAKAERNSEKENILLQWNPELSIQLNNGDIVYQGFASKISIPAIDFDYSNQEFNITEGQVKVGKSDFTLSGEIRNIGPWLDNTGDLRGELTLQSDYTDVPEIMSLTSGIGNSEQETEPDPQESQSEEDDGPYMVPKGVNLSLHTQINRALMPFINQTAYDLGGGIYVRDGILVVEEMGFICNAAKLQLTAMYETPRRNNLFVGLDYHMIDIDLEQLVNMIPQVDTVLPMLRSFRGNAEFHLAAETYLNSKYEVKWSTTRGACSIAGRDLTLIDGQTFSTVAKLLNFKNKKAENQVDSISAEITLFRKEIDVYPFLMTMDKYKAAVGGRHNLDMTCNYHVSLLSPTYLGVNISGALDDIIDKPLKHIKIEKAHYARDFLPQYRGEVESQNQSLRQMIREALKSNLDD